ncbi:NB-ARC domain-containing protein [Actinomadura rubrisoli]|uniref:AAA+ ATPase domain-containing protein n=1 Tax=Actinomadura rubrisoli TaxID=2530368 RepID=A0A4R5AIL9_9ACTN|nr:NB-ARC domain-containing protein [Actinomadura rubrisoli]TDD72483.1 hypothetical protein E1298_35045 [Actinomadura rubrisoli]
MENAPTPHCAATPAEFMLRLRQLKEWTGLTYRQLEARGRRHGDGLPRSTLAATLRRGGLPREEFVESLVKACGQDPVPWTGVRRRLAVQSMADGAEGSAPAAAVPPPAPAPGGASWAAGGAGGPDAPHQLPVGTGVLVGRDREVAEVARLAGGDGAGAPIVVVSGPPGVGKSALGVRAAHLAAARFPDGQIYVDVRGASPGTAPLTPVEIAGRLLRGLRGPGAPVPADAEEAAALLRSVLADRRVLVVLDDVASAAQVRPLVPFGRRCAALMTSRTSLTSLDGARCLRLGRLAPRDAETVLERFLGAERVAAEPDAVRLLADLCDGLPLGLRVAAARLAARPGWPLGALAERLSDPRGRLDEFRVDDLEVRASLAVSFDALAGSDDAQARAAARALPLLADLPGGDVRLPEAAALLHLSSEETGRALERLVDASLVESPAPGAYRVPDLVRLFARERRAPAPAARSA